MTIAAIQASRLTSIFATCYFLLLPIWCWLPTGITFRLPAHCVRSLTLQFRHAPSIGVYSASICPPAHHSRAVALQASALGITSAEEQVRGQNREDADSPLHALAVHALAMLASSEDERSDLVHHAKNSRHVIQQLLQEYDLSHTGQLEAEEAKELFSNLARELLREAASSGTGAAAAHARALLAPEASDEEQHQRLSTTVERMSEQLLKIADRDENGIVSLEELADLFENNLGGLNSDVDQRPSTFELYELRGSLQMLPRIARHFDPLGPLDTQRHTETWHETVAGDSHTLMRWVSPTHKRDKLSIVGMGRSADASCYYLPEWGVVLDAGVAVKTITPKCVLLSHGHRDHTQALSVLARANPFKRTPQGSPEPAPKVLLPQKLEPLVRQFLVSESILNFGSEEAYETVQTQWFGADHNDGLDLHPVADGDVIHLPRHCHSGAFKDLAVEVYAAPHKGLPAVAFGFFRVNKKLKPEYRDQQHRIREILAEAPGTELTEEVRENLLFYSGDTTIELLQSRASEILEYRYIIHEVTFIGPPSKDLDEQAHSRGHTHYAQLHPFICAAPQTVFILVHFSIRYTREDVEAFFEEQYGGVPCNVVLWIK